MLLFLISFLIANTASHKSVKELWTPVVSDHLGYWTSITVNITEATYSFYGSKIIVQNINREIFVYDPKGYCVCNKSVYGENKFFESHYKLCKSIVNIVKAAVNRDSIQDFEIVVSLDDIPLWRDYENRPLPGFGATRCRESPGLSIPFLGTNILFDINDISGSIGNINTGIPFIKKQNRAVFRGVQKGCSHERDVYDRYPPYRVRRDRCGRNLLADYAKNNSRYIDFTDEYMSQEYQEDNFKYIVVAEGFGGWTDRLFYLPFRNNLIISQEHPCDQWFEPLFYAYEHYLPVKHDFKDLSGKVKWANDNPRQVVQIIRNSNEFSKTYFSREAILDYVSVLLNTYIDKMSYRPQLRSGSVNIDILFRQDIVKMLCHNLK